jgi:probable F420-dependent oxidoreductase
MTTESPALPTPARREPLDGTARFGFMTGSWPLGLPPDGGFYRQFAAQVERSGFDLLFSGDHLFMHNPNADALALLATYGGVTERVLLGTGVLLPALREPVVMAKQLATIDYVSGGRLIAGMGVGGEIEQEWRAMEIPREERGARTDEALDLMQAFWSGEELNFDGRFRHVHGVTGSPAPASAGGPPIWIGGRSDAALSRAARYDGWCAYSTSLNRMRRSLATIEQLRPGGLEHYRVSYAIFTYVSDVHEEAREMAARILRKRYEQDFDDFLDVFCAVGTPDHIAERFAQYQEAGVQDFLMVPQCPWENYGEQVERMAALLPLNQGPKP